MAASSTRRRDPRSLATRSALIETAETMFAEDGLDGVSTRQIGAAIGSSNNAVVAYHFGGKDALIDAIYLHRLPQIERRRCELIAKAEANGRADDMETILFVLWLPLFEQVNNSGQHSYARFLSTMIRHGFRRTREIVSKDFPTALNLIERLKPKLAFDTGSSWDLRWSVVTNMILDALRHIDNSQLGTTPAAESLFREAIKMAMAALTAPCPSATDNEAGINEPVR